MQRFPPTQIELEFGGQPRTFRLSAKHVAKLQEACGRRMTWPDGGAGMRPKPLGTIWREHAQGDYDLRDSLQILVIGLECGSKLTPLDARAEVERVCEDWPAQEIWKHATSVLVACCQGFQPPGETGAAAKKRKAKSKKTSSSTTRRPSAASPSSAKDSTASPAAT